MSTPDIGGMSKKPLLVSQILEHAAKLYGQQEIVSRMYDGSIHRYKFTDCLQRSKLLALALQRLGVSIARQERIATLAYSTYRHVELYYAVPGIGAVLNTVNPRLFEKEIAYIINHAEDKAIFFDPHFLPLVEKIFPQIKGTVKHLIALCSRNEMPRASDSAALPPILCYEDLLAREEAQLATFAWPLFDETLASILCYTSGTTGNPKGVLYEHRSTWLHCTNMAAPNYYNTSAHSCVAAIAPMYHSSGWWMAYICPLTGGKLVLPGAKLDSENLYTLMAQERVDSATAVPTIWIALIQYLEQDAKRALPHFKTIISSGSAFPRALIEKYLTKYGVTVKQIYGSTEINVGTFTQLTPQEEKLPISQIVDICATAGRQVHLVETRIVDDKGNVLPNDGKSVGHIQTRGQNVLRAYYKNEGAHNFTKEGWFSTGDMGFFDEKANLIISDRTKDMIKSGGEWISSIFIENIAMAHPKIKEAAVVGIPHPKWEERPLLIVSLKDGQQMTKQEIIALLQEKVAKWQLPDDIVFVQNLPHGPTGKILKKELREEYKNYKLPTAKL